VKDCPEWTQGEGRTALMEAFQEWPRDDEPEGVDRTEVVRLLLQAGADPNLRDKAGYTALILCKTDTAAALLLLKAGANPNARTLEGVTALSNTYSDEMEELLLKYGAAPSNKDSAPEP
jgi:ankyrin repeat protein